jgi:exonuclease SbcC
VRITRLTLAGFGPYKNEQVVDFERFADDGIFLITGKTGAGKSSILDAICYALYASVPRYEQAQQQLRSDHCDIDDPTFVELEFTINGTDYRVRRSPEFERPKQRGSGTTKQAATAELAENTGDGWRGLSARSVDVARDLDRILGLSKDQFLQVILLAQNRFQKFLKSTNDERQAVLRTLFGTRRFERIETILTERRKALGAELEVVAASLRQRAEQAATLVDQIDAGGEPSDLASIPEHIDENWFARLSGALRGQLADATRDATAADTRATLADLEHQRVVHARRLQERRAAGEATLRTLEDERADVDHNRVLLADAHRAAAVWMFVTALRDAQSALQTATTREEIARTGYAEFADDPGSANRDDTSGEADSLDATVDTVTRLLGALADVAADEKRLPALASDVTRAEERLRLREREIVTATASMTTLPTEIADLSTAITASQVDGARRADAEAAVARVTTALRSARRAVALAADVTAAELVERNASSRHTASALRLDALLEERLSGHAAELASTLVDGVPCMVCGATSHPAPALSDNEPVTEARITAARTELTAARQTMDTAHAAVLALTTQLTEAQTRADGKTVDDLTVELTDASTAFDTAQAAVTRSRAQEGELTALRARLDTVTSELTALAEQRVVAERHLAEAQHTADAASQRVSEHRAEFPSVGARVEHLRRHLTSARALVAAIAQTAVARDAASSASAKLDAELTEQHFASENAVLEARRPAPEVAALDRRIREYDQSIAAVRATLADPELVDLPHELVTTDAASEDLRQARAARDDALRIQNSLAERTTRLATITAAAVAEMSGTERARLDYGQLRELANAVQGLEPNTKRMRLETFVLAAQLEEIVAAANARLRTMTGGRFMLEHNDGLQYRNTQSGLGLSILDQHTGRSRATHSLSGGETFLASLALALGLAEVVTNQTGGITLDTLFIDEGFGSLDSETLETAMSTLDSLRAGGRTIGLISHVDTMKEQISAKLRIVVTDRGYSEIETRVDLN